MRRVGGLWPQVTSLANLLAATGRAARGKRRQRQVARFLAEREPRLLELRRELLDDRYRPGRLSSFVLHDPKRRTIAVAPFRDRVVHHAVIDRLEPIFDRRMLHTSFACRRGKGTHAALDQAQRMVRRTTWFLKMDVARFFASIPHAVALDTVARLVKDRAVLRLLARIVEAGGQSSDVGLPIGNLTSQWLANLVLGPIDRLAVERLRVGGYVRYMDDFVLFDDDRERLRGAKSEVDRSLAELGLLAKPRATILAPTRDGLPFLGFLVFPTVRRVRPANRKRVIRRWKHWLWQWRHGQQSDEALADAVRSMMAHLEHGTTRGWRRRWCAALEGRGPV